jgi:hypothetical protein
MHFIPVEIDINYFVHCVDKWKENKEPQILFVFIFLQIKARLFYELVHGFFEQNILEEDGRSRKPERVFASRRKKKIKKFSEKNLFPEIVPFCWQKITFVIFSLFGHLEGRLIRAPTNKQILA